MSGEGASAASTLLSRSLFGRAWRRALWFYRRRFQNRCHVFVHRGPFPPEHRDDCAFHRFDRFDDVPQDVRDAVVAYRDASQLEMDAKEIRDGATMWGASCDGVLASVVFTRRGRDFRRWFLPLRPDDVVVFRLRTYPAFRGRGLAPSLMRQALHEYMQEGNDAYIDCRVYNKPSIRSITKTGFQRIATMKPIRREEAIGRGLR